MSESSGTTSRRIGGRRIEIKKWLWGTTVSVDTIPHMVTHHWTNPDWHHGIVIIEITMEHELNPSAWSRKQGSGGHNCVSPVPILLDPKQEGKKWRTHFVPTSSVA